MDVDRFLDIASPHLKGAVRDGVILGLKMSADTLTSAKPLTDPANQTWDSAVAMLGIVRAEYEAKTEALSHRPKEATDD